jgi:hypothetical protein
VAQSHCSHASVTNDQKVPRDGPLPIDYHFSRAEQTTLISSMLANVQKNLAVTVSSSRQEDASNVVRVVAPASIGISRASTYEALCDLPLMQLKHNSTLSYSMQA